jgi:hypothetical protein
MITAAEARAMEAETNTNNREEDRLAFEYFLNEADVDVKKAIECGKKEIGIYIPHIRYSLGNYNDVKVALKLYLKLIELGYTVIPLDNTTMKVTWQAKEESRPNKSFGRHLKELFC